MGNSPQSVTVCSTTLFRAAGSEFGARGKKFFGSSRKDVLAKHEVKYNEGKNTTKFIS